MAAENMKHMLLRARRNGYAVGAFNILDYNSMRAVVRAAEELASPVIIQTSVKTVVFWGAARLAAWYRELAADSTAPVALHLDHCQDLEMIKTCIEAGWTSVMIDASSRPFEENLALTRQVIRLAGERGVSVEAELGRIGGVEDDLSVEERASSLVDPELAERFCRDLPLDCFAPAVGTAHGLYKGEPQVAFALIGEVAGRVAAPLALHGGTGLSDDVFKEAIQRGCAKINISTQLKHDFIDSCLRYCERRPDEYNPLKLLDMQFHTIKDTVAANLRLFGSAGAAN